eukprot:ctg_4650.g508
MGRRFVTDSSRVHARAVAVSRACTAGSVATVKQQRVPPRSEWKNQVERRKGHGQCVQRVSRPTCRSQGGC